MGSTCCKNYDSPYTSPQMPDFSKLFTTCSEQFQFCQKYKPKEDETPPKPRKFSRSDISAPLPIGCTQPMPKRPPRKRKCRLLRSQSLVVESMAKASHLPLTRSKSIHEIVYQGSHRIYDESDEVEDTDTATPLGFCLPVPIGATSPSPFSIYDVSYITPRLEPILESDYEDTAAAAATITDDTGESSSLNSLNDLVADSKRHFLATLLAAEDNNNQLNSLPSRKSSITESLREFESSLYDMLEQQQESTKDEIEEIKWKPQIPIY